MPYLCYKWGTCSVPWNLASWTWGECSLVQEVIAEVGRGGVPGELAVPSWLREEETIHDPYKKEKRGRFIQLLCKVKKYPAYDEKKMVRDDITVTSDDVVLVIKTVSGIDITAKIEK
jgi:hypothetical protein